MYGKDIYLLRLPDLTGRVGQAFNLRVQVGTPRDVCEASDAETTLSGATRMDSYRNLALDRRLES